MITIQRRRANGVVHEYKVYEPGDEIPSQLRVVPYRNRRSAMRGELVTDITGKMVPLLRRITIDKRNNRVLMIFPGFTWQPWKNDMFSYPVDKASEPDMPRSLTSKHFAFAGLISEGMPVELAMSSVWPKMKGKAMKNMVRKTFSSQAFIHYLFVELGYVKKLKEALEKRQVSVDQIAGEIEDLITNEKANPGLKKWALETALEALDPQEKGSGQPMLQEGTRATLLSVETVGDGMAEKMARLHGKAIKSSDEPVVGAVAPSGLIDGDATVTDATDEEV